METLQKRWFQARNAFFRALVLFFAPSVQLQTTNYDVNFHSLWLFFVLFTRFFFASNPFICSQPHPSYASRCIFISFFVWEREKKRELNKAQWILLIALHLDSVVEILMYRSSVVCVCMWVLFIRLISSTLSLALCEKVTKNYNNSNIIL